MNQQTAGRPFLHSRAFRSAAVAVRVATLLILSVSAAKAADQKLILKDGSDQIVKSYEVTGDRVRYYSTERQEWEEMPASLVDWDATEQAKHDAEKLPEIEAEKNKPDPRRVLAPAAILPADDGVFAFDGTTVLPLGQSQAVVTNDLKRKILTMAAPLPVLKAHAWILLPGESSAQLVVEAGTVFYLQLSAPAQEGYALVRVQPKEDKRVVGEIAISTLTRSATESRQIVPTTMEQVIPTENGKPAVMRLAPKAPLEPGEYAVVEFIAKDKQNLLVWDFRYSSKTVKKP